LINDLRLPRSRGFGYDRIAALPRLVILFRP
jgi:hypothetical protein